jgi:hypothetical protein
VGDAALVERMLAGWPESWREAPELLGRVRTPEVEAFLKHQALSDDTERQSMAVEALARFYGCPDPLASYVGRAARDDKDLSDLEWAGLATLVLDRDPLAAVLQRTRPGPYAGNASDAEVSGFGLSQDPRVLERLGLWRERRDFELYWPATACLALGGNEAARREWRAFLEQARTFLLDSLQNGRWFTLNGDPEWTAYWVSRLDANCCYGWHAQEVLKATYPTFPFGHSPGAAGRTRRGAERWFERHKGTFVWSPILDGWIPGPRR